jgi:hypothetical protein
VRYENMAWETLIGKNRKAEEYILVGPETFFLFGTFIW